MINVFDIAKYILNKCGELTTMKLQKLVYYSQAWSLAWDDVPLFNEEFEAWANGPVCRTLYNHHKGRFVVEPGFFDNFASNEPLTSIQQETLEAVIKFYGDREPHWLSELTHKELPWRMARGTCEPGETCSTIITKESMQSYYGSLQ